MVRPTDTFLLLSKGTGTAARFVWRGVWKTLSEERRNNKVPRRLFRKRRKEKKKKKNPFSTRAGRVYPASWISSFPSFTGMGAVSGVVPGVIRRLPRPVLPPVTPPVLPSYPQVIPPPAPRSCLASSCMRGGKLPRSTSQGKASRTRTNFSSTW
mgnify:CR=1 FL=1